MDLRCCIVTFDERHDMRVMQALEDIDFGGKVLFKLPVELGHVDGLDGYKSFGSLKQMSACCGMRGSTTRNARKN